MTKRGKKHPVQRQPLRVRAYPVLAAAVEVGVNYGWNRAHKHNPDPSEEAIKGAIEEAVMSQICDAFDFPGDDRG